MFFFQLLSYAILHNNTTHNTGNFFLLLIEIHLDYRVSVAFLLHVHTFFEFSVPPRRGSEFTHWSQS